MRRAAALLLGALFPLACDGAADPGAGGQAGAAGQGGAGGQAGAAGQGGDGGQAGSAGKGGAGGAAGQGGAFPLVDECAEGTATCSPDADCIDTPGFYECVCHPGFEGDGSTCDDVDECQTLLHDCDPNASCTNLPGSYSCACPPGFEGDGSTCSARYLEVAAGLYHACAVRADHTLWCWGHNTSGQAGTGTADVFFARPAQASGAPMWKHVTAGNAFSCALDQAGAAWCFGTNGFGQLGTGSLTAKSTPTLGAGGGSDWLAIDAGLSHACGVKVDGSAHCWGRNNVGQLGDGSKDNNGDGVADNELVPVAVAGGASWLSVSAGVDFSCGIQADHSLWCWGTNGSRQLGTGTTTESAVPVREKSLATDWASVDAGSAATCAVKLGGQRYCWGANNFSQGGDGTDASIVEPKQVDNDSNWAAVRLSFDAGACGLRGAGEVWCWGDGSLGQTAQSTNEAVLPNPMQVGARSDWVSLSLGNRFACGVRANGELSCWGATSRGALGSGFGSDRNEPELVGAETTWSAIATNTDDACGLRGGDLFCWGRNALTNLGDGTNVTRTLPTAVGAGLSFEAVGVGRFFGCGIVAGELYCWGRDDAGQLGNGPNVTHSPSPSLAAATANASPWVELATGQDGACARKQDETAWCWGSDGVGQVGDGGAATTQHTPKQLAGADWTHLSQARDTVCGLRGAGTLWCWGRNDNGQVGTGAAGGTVAAPTQVGQGAYARVSAGAFHACAIDLAGALWCWGRNSSGELGLGTTATPVPSPTKVGTDSDWTDVFVGVGAHTCATKVSGALFCWGASAFGQLGRGTYATQTTPGEVLSLVGFSSASLGSDHTCALRLDGRVACWGASYSAQLGSGVPFFSSPTPVLEPL